MKTKYISSKYISLCVTLVAVLIGSFILASEPQAPMTDRIAVCPDDAQEELRVSPAIHGDTLPPPYIHRSYEAYPWLDIEANHITMNGADWGPLSRRVADTGSTPFRIVLIGDSHIQADGATGVTRRILQNRYGSAGRGMITPLKLAGTNQPADYRITSSTPGWRTARLMKRPWASPMLFTGVSATPPADDFDLTVKFMAQSGQTEFHKLKLYYGGITPQVLRITNADGREIGYSTKISGSGCREIDLRRSLPECTLDMRSAGETSIGGIELLAGYGGVEFSAIGNNGAAYSSYLGLDTGRGISLMNPDLIIISLGTNDAWGNLSEEAFVESVDALVAELHNENPDSRILLTTPAETQKNTHGRYAPHEKVARFRDLIKDYGATHRIAVYDFYEVAGGTGSSHEWIRTGLFSRDRIHLSWNGYSLMGQLLADALIETLENRPHVE